MKRFRKQRAVWAAVLATIVIGGCEIGTEKLPTGADDPAAPPLVQTRPVDADSARRSRPLTTVPPRPIARGKLAFVEDYARGYARAVSAGKPMLVFFTAPWCGFCHEMADEAFTDPAVVRLSERFVCILVDAEREPEVCQQFQVAGYPTIQFVSPRGVALQRVVGKQPGRQVLMAMQAALQRVARRELDNDEAAAK